MDAPRYRYVSPSRTRFDRVRCELCNPLTGNRRTTSYERAINYRNTRKKPRREFKTVRVKGHISKEFSIVRIEKKLRKYLEGIDTCNPLFFERKLSELWRIEEKKKARKLKARLEIATLWLENRYSTARTTPLLVPPIAVNFDLMIVKAPNATYS